MMRSLRLVALALVLAFGTAAVPAQAQQQGGAPNPTATSVQEQQLLQELSKLRGRVSIPDQQAGMLMQPQGRSYRAFHEGALPWIAGILILGMIAAIAAFYFWRGRIRLQRNEYTGRTITRFNFFERFTHWLTATSFIVLALTGLNYFLGKRLLMPLLGADAFSAWSQWAKYAHNFMAWPFMLGVVLIVILWVRDNLPERTDWAWLKAGGGFFGRKEPDSRRFNAGQKLVFWSVAVFGIALSVTGIFMLFPFWALDINGMQVAQYIHSVGAVLFIAIIIAHIYIGTLGMEGAYEAMWSGQVDLAWARHHHRAWVEEQQAKTASGPQLRRGTAPAE
jgi:formate dehydrogenase subunit gamma